MTFLINIGLNIVIILFTGFWFLRFFTEMGLSGKGRIGRFVSCTTDYKGERLTKKDVCQVLLFAFLIRLLVYFASIFIAIIQSDFSSQASAFSLNDFLSLWNKSDASHYLDLAEKGYAGCVEVPEWSGREEHLFLSSSRYIPG